MRLDQLIKVLIDKKGPFTGWTLANLGGLVVTYLAAMTIWIFHGTFGIFLPGPEVYLITGTISLAMTGVSYVSMSKTAPVLISPILSYAWPFPLALVYGTLIAMGVKPPAIDASKVWAIAIILSVICFFWSALTWLHEQGIRSDMEQQSLPSTEPPKVLRDTANRLPKLQN